MWMHVYRRRDGDYELAPKPRGPEREGALYLGVVSGTAFTGEVRAGIATQLQFAAVARLTPAQFYGEARAAG